MHNDTLVCVDLVLSDVCGSFLLLDERINVVP